MRSVGVMGDGRRYDYVVALRAVETTDFMTARWARLPFSFTNYRLRPKTEYKPLFQREFSLAFYRISPTLGLIKWTLSLIRSILCNLMKGTKNKSILPLRLRRAIAKLGADIAVARRKRSFTVGMMAERIGVHKNTYLKVEKGDPSVSFGIYAMALFVLGLSDALTALADPGRDDTGLLLDADYLPKRVRPPKEPQAL